MSEIDPIKIQCCLSLLVSSSNKLEVCLVFAFSFLLTLHFLSATRDVLFYLLFLISVLTSPTPYQELIKGLFVLIAKIVIPGNESVKMCLHEIAAAECALNEMLCSSKSPELSKQVRLILPDHHHQNLCQPSPQAKLYT